MATVQNTITYSIVFNDNSAGAGALLLGVNDMKDEFLWGIPLCNPVTGQTISSSTILEKIRAAQDYVEGQLDLRIFKQYVGESKHFVRDEYQNWGFIKASLFVNKPYYLTGTLNGQQVLKFPNEWVTVYRKVNKDSMFERCLYFVPNGHGSAVSFAYNFTINNLYAFYGSRVIPEYWFLEYLTGFEVIPASIGNVIGKYAAVQLLPIIEMTVTSGGGLAFGSASNSLGLDGMSQSISKANGGNIFKQRIEQYTRELKEELTQLHNRFAGLTFDVM